MRVAARRAHLLCGDPAAGCPPAALRAELLLLHDLVLLLGLELPLPPPLPLARLLDLRSVRCFPRGVLVLSGVG